MRARAEVEVARPWAPFPLAIRSKNLETPGVVTLFIEPPAAQGFAFAPGQFNMLYAFGVGEVPISMSGPPEDPGTIVHTIRDVGAVTHALTELQPGDALGVRGPFGEPWPMDAAEGKDVVVIAGGIGLAPLRPAIYSMLHERERFRRITLLYGARTPADLLYAGELASWRSRFDVQVEITVDTAGADWRGDVGVVTTVVPRAAFDAEDTVAFVCGPEVMMRFAVGALQQRGLADERIFVSLERNMRCAFGQCGHCQIGPVFACEDGPVFSWDFIRPWIARREV